MKEIIENKIHYLYPSNLIVKKNEGKVLTVLGSCVSVCLIDLVNKIGGINHFMLPYWNGVGLASPKYGNIAIEKLIGEMIKMGAKKENIKAKVFGGANQTNSTLNIGLRNCEVAFELLNKFNIKVVSKSVGGEVGRKIVFDIITGEVRMKYVGNTKE